MGADLSNEILVSGASKNQGILYQKLPFEAQSGCDETLLTRWQTKKSKILDSNNRPFVTSARRKLLVTVYY